MSRVKYRSAGDDPVSAASGLYVGPSWDMASSCQDGKIFRWPHNKSPESRYYTTRYLLLNERLGIPIIARSAVFDPRPE